MPEAERVAIGERARQKVLSLHTSRQRAAELERYVAEVIGSTAFAAAAVEGALEGAAS
jgi:hypothetical protein